MIRLGFECVYKRNPEISPFLSQYVVLCEYGHYSVRELFPKLPPNRNVRHVHVYVNNIERRRLYKIVLREKLS